jgi:hypothetical protein
VVVAHGANADSEEGMRRVTGFLAEKGSPAPAPGTNGERMKLVVVESPYAGARWDVPHTAEEARNLRYLRACMADCFKRGEAPYASHGLYTQPGVLRDEVPEERKLGIEAGFAWGCVAKVRAFYMDLGVSSGMRYGADEADRLGQAIEYRDLGPNWDIEGLRAAADEAAAITDRALAEATTP